jgi:hypothetical protein
MPGGLETTFIYSLRLFPVNLYVLVTSNYG